MVTFKQITIKYKKLTPMLLDDALIFGEGSRKHIKNLISILKNFRKVSGLAINLSKSTLYGIGVSSDDIKNLVISINCKGDTVPFIYLGLPVDKDMSRLCNWSNVIVKFTNRLSSWKANCLSFGVVRPLQSFKEDSKGIYWVKWRTALAGYDQGGLGIGKIFPKLLWKERRLHGDPSQGQKTSMQENIRSIGDAIDGLDIPFNSSFVRKAWRNKVLHSMIDERKEELKVDIFPRIQSSSLLWFSNRWRKENKALNWSVWVSKPFDIGLVVDLSHS
ncbi:hypothetical protein Tco_1533178 [Tanacetum coccineum]